MRKAKIADETKEFIISCLKEGELKQSEIASLCNVSNTTICKIKQSMLETSNVDIVICNSNELKKEGSEKNIVDWTGTNIRLLGTNIDIINPDIVQLKKKGIHEIGLVADRHNIPVSNYIFETLDTEKGYDYGYLSTTAYEYIKNNVEPDETLVVYCTGLQSPLAALIKAAYECQQNLILMHYMNSTREYAPQIIWDQFGRINTQTFIFDSIIKNQPNSTFYGYKCDYNNIIEFGDNLYIITLGNMDNSAASNNRIINGAYIVCLNEKMIWELYPELIRSINDDSLCPDKHQSVMVSEAFIKNGKIIYKSKLTKGYNYK